VDIAVTHITMTRPDPGSTEAFAADRALKKGFKNYGHYQQLAALGTWCRGKDRLLAD
jgi:hypothetical protein